MVCNPYKSAIRMVKPPIDYAAIRAALVKAMSLGTGLGTGQIIQAQAEQPNAPRPARPYATFQVKRSAIRNGMDAVVPAPAFGPSMYTYIGERGIDYDLTLYGQTHEQAYTLAASLQTSLGTEPINGVLGAVNASVWSVGDVMDLSALLNTGFEGRALLELELWTTSQMVIDLGSIETVNTLGIISVDDTLGQATLAQTIGQGA
jgi:hypothetical protein